jgi:hypothetical protein
MFPKRNRQLLHERKINPIRAERHSVGKYVFVTGRTSERLLLAAAHGRVMNS